MEFLTENKDYLIINKIFELLCTVLICFVLNVTANTQEVGRLSLSFILVYLFLFPQSELLNLRDINITEYSFVLVLMYRLLIEHQVIFTTYSSPFQYADVD